MRLLRSITFLNLLLLIMLPTALSAQEKQAPIVKDFGAVYLIDGAEEMPDSTKMYKILIELVSGNKKSEEPSFWINNVARMMNLHGVAGVSGDNLQVKVVVHGGAVLDIVSDEKYSREFEVEKNPNAAILEALQEAGAEVLVCGQSLIAREIPTEELQPGVKVALSALTTISKNVADGYVMLKF